MSEEITRWRKKPLEVEAVRWTGDNVDAVFVLTGCENFDVLDEQQRRDCGDQDATAAVFDKLHSTWVLVMTGQWIIRGVKGEFYPCAADVFAETYEAALPDDAWRLTPAGEARADAAVPDLAAFIDAADYERKRVIALTELVAEIVGEVSGWSRDPLDTDQLIADWRERAGIGDGE